MKRELKGRWYRCEYSSFDEIKILCKVFVGFEELYRKGV